MAQAPKIVVEVTVRGFTPQEERALAGIAQQQSWEAALTWFSELDGEAQDELIERHPHGPVLKGAIQEMYDDYLVGMAEAQADNG